MPNAALRAALGQDDPARRYIYDRCNGTSIYPRGEEESSNRPYCYLCWVPPPVYAWPSACEQNAMCECIGRTGCCGRQSRKLRSALLTIVLLVNYYAMGLTVFSNFAASDNMDILKIVHFVEGNTLVPTSGAFATVKTYVGLDYVGVRDEGRVGVLGGTTETVFTWNDFCNNFTGPNDSFVKAFESEAACQKCADASSNTANLMLYSLLASVPLLATDVLRRFPNYDVNCQKTWALLASAGALFCSFWAWFTFDEDCFNILFNPDDEESLDVQTDNESSSTLWEAGPALICLFVASALRAVHLLGHWVVPTPTICYDAEDQLAYERQHFAILSISVPHGQTMSEVEDGAVKVPPPPTTRTVVPNPSFDEDESSVYTDEG